MSRDDFFDEEDFLLDDDLAPEEILDLRAVAGTSANEPMSAEERAELAAFFHGYNAEVLKRMANLWAGPRAGTRKEQCVQAMVGVLADPAKLREMIGRLTPFQRAGLGLLMYRGGVAPSVEFAAELLGLGLPFERVGLYYNYGYGYNRGGSGIGALSALMATGLVLDTGIDDLTGTSRQTCYFRHTYVAAVTTFGRVAPLLTVQAPEPLKVEPVEFTGHGRFRRPAEAALPMISLIDALRKEKEILLTNRGRFSKSLINRLVKRVGLDAPAAAETQTPLEEATFFYLQLLMSGRFFTPPGAGGEIRLSTVVDDAIASPYEIQVLNWVRGYRSLKGWHESLPPTVALYSDNAFSANSIHAFRALVLLTLGALPDPERWYAVQAFSDALYARVGDQFSIAYVYPFYTTQRDPTKAERERQAYLQKQHANWQQREEVLLRNMLIGPLFHLGLVELSFAETDDTRQRLRFRLTDLGRTALYDTLRPGSRPMTPAAESLPSEPCWVVQPNFEVIAYLDRASPAQLGFLGRIAERKSLTGAVGVYSITRESVYHSLEAGMAVEAILETLQAGAKHDLPEVVARSIRDWAGRRERIAVYVDASLLEFPDRESRDAELSRKSGLGRPVGDRFVLVEKQGSAAKPGVAVGRTVDYHAVASRCVRVSEEGLLELIPEKADLLVSHELDAIARRVVGNSHQWVLDAKSVGEASQAGFTGEAILSLLGQRSQGGIPAILRVAISRWALKRRSSKVPALGKVTLLQLPTLEIADALAGSRRAAPYLQARLGPQTFLVPSEAARPLGKLLVELGLEATGAFESLEWSPD